MEVYSDKNGWPCVSGNRIEKCLCVGPENCKDKECPLVKERNQDASIIKADRRVDNDRR